MQEFSTINKKTSRLVEISTPFNIVENYKDNSITSLQCGHPIVTGKQSYRDWLDKNFE